MKRKRYMLLVAYALLLSIVIIGASGESAYSRASKGNVETIQQSASQIQSEEMEKINKRLKRLEDRMSLVAVIKDVVPGIAVIASLVAMGFFMRDRWRPAMISGKIVSIYSNTTRDSCGTIGLLYLLRMMIFSRYRHFHYKDMKGRIKFPSKEGELECKIQTWRTLVMKRPDIVDGRIADISKKLKNVVSEKYLTLSVVFPRNQAMDSYISFTVNHDKDEMFEYIKFIFEDYRGKAKELTLKAEDIEGSKLLSDDEIWEDIDEDQIARLRKIAEAKRQ